MALGRLFSFACCLTLGAIFVTFNSSRADNESSVSDMWDATTMDIHGERKSLAGTWEYMPWHDLTKLPDFQKVQPMQIPGSQIAGAYRTRFKMGSASGIRRSILQFDAVAFRCAVFVNGKQIGNHAGGMTPFEFDITDQVHPGDNELIVLILGAKGRALSAEAADVAKVTYNERGQALASGGDKMVLGGGMWPADGIRQGVYLREVSAIRVSDATVVTSFREKKMTVSVNLTNQTAGKNGIDIECEILPYDIGTHKIGDHPIWINKQKIIARRGKSDIKIIQQWNDPQLWMPGDPHLYVARLRMRDEAGQLLDERNIRFGFREVWLEGQRIMINGKPFRAFVHGSLDSEASPEVIRTMFRQVMAAGINMVRPHTRPPLPSFASIADEMGMAIIGESELCFNSNYAYEQPVFWSNFERLFRERIARDKNHPSILIWSLANEVIISSPGAKIGQHFYDAFLYLRQVDPTRPFMQEGDGDLRDMVVNSKGFPIDIINLHLYDINPRKNPLWATEFPPIAWALESVKKPQQMPATNKFGNELPDRSRPWFIGEFGLAQVGYPDFFSFWTGPEAYRDLFGKAEELIRAIGEITTIQLQAFRDMNMAGMDPWDMPDKLAFAPFLQRGLEPITIFTRDFYAHWTGGEMARRHLVTINDSFEEQNLKLTVVIRQGDKELSRREENFKLLPGGRQDTYSEYLTPKVSEKSSLKFVIQLTDKQGRQVSGFQQNWFIYPEISPAMEWQHNEVWLCGSSKNLGEIAKWAKTRVRLPAELNLAEHNRPAVVILDQPTADSLDGKAHVALDRYVESGGVVMLSGANRPFTGDEMLVSNSDSDSTKIFPLQKSPLTEGTSASDWEFWRPDHFVSHGNYTMPFDPIFELPLVGGGRNGIMYCPLAVIKKGKGVIVASRLQLDPSVSEEPVARLFLNNLVSYAKTLQNGSLQYEPTLVIFCPSDEKSAWKERMQKVHIPFCFDEGSPLLPGKQIAFLSGKAAISAIQLDQLKKFVTAGGTLWMHRLSPQTEYLNAISPWLGQPVNLRTPKMWLQQMELADPSSPSSLLNGINDYITCWATFGWTNGDFSTVRTTPILDYVLTEVASNGVVLLKEPDWIGKWNSKPGGYMLSQAIALEIGHHTRNEKPGAGLVVYKFGRGRILLDQICWDTVMMDASSESKDKARYFGGNLWKNISTDNNSGISMKL